MFVAGCGFFVMLLTAGVEAATPGIVGITHGSVDFAVPPETPEGESWYYGLGLPIQLDATMAGLMLNIRRNGTPYCDFEAGTDLILFDSLDGIREENAIAISRPAFEPNPWTGAASITSKYPVMGGFVPLGGRLANGVLHPQGGTGFGICEVGWYPADYNQPLSGRIGYKLEMQQFSYDGNNFSFSSPVRYDQIAIGGSGWNINGVGLSPAIPDGNDLLFPVSCSNFSYSGVSGIARFVYGQGGWQPTAFIPVTPLGESWFEPSLIRDNDGSLLFTARNDSTAPLALWLSADGDAWNQLFRIDYARAYAPVLLNRAVDGTPFLVTSTAAAGSRNILEMVPINSDRSGVEAAITVRNAPVEFGPAAPTDPAWHVDHGTGNVVRLADGNWHSIVTYRVDAHIEHFGGSATPYTGHYVEEVSSAGDSRLTGFAFSPPSGGSTIFRDDFQSDSATISGSAGQFNPAIGAGDAGGVWTMIEAPDEPFIQVVNDNAPWSGIAGTNNYVAIERQSGHMDARLRAQGWNSEELRDGTLKVSLSIYVPSGNNSGAAITGWDDNGWIEPWWENRAFDTYFNPDGTVSTYDGNGYVSTGLTYDLDAWQEVTITADLAACTFSIDIEGNMASGFIWTSGSKTIKSLTFMPDSSNTKFCIDNLEIERFLPILSGDANDDGVVDQDDAARLAENWLIDSAAVWSMGDFNGDGKVNDIDASILGANWGKTLAAVASVPEPCSGLFFLFFAIAASIIYSHTNYHQQHNKLERHQ